MQALSTHLYGTVVLFATWILLSGKLDAAHLGAGAAISATITVATVRLWALPPLLGAAPFHPFRGFRWLRLPRYFAVLAWEIALSAVQVTYLVLHPRLPIDPQLVRFRADLPHTLSRLALANSITLTPGTVTIEVEGDEFLVHALTPASARGIELGVLRNWIAGLFADAARPGGGSPS